MSQDDTADLPFIDALQKRHARQVGWMPRQELEGKIGQGQVPVAEDGGGGAGAARPLAGGGERGTIPAGGGGEV